MLTYDEARCAQLLMGAVLAFDKTVEIGINLFPPETKNTTAVTDFGRISARWCSGESEQAVGITTTVGITITIGMNDTSCVRALRGSDNSYTQQSLRENRPNLPTTWLEDT
jgi:hypothetical protein